MALVVVLIIAFVFYVLWRVGLRSRVRGEWYVDVSGGKGLYSPSKQIHVCLKRRWRDGDYSKNKILVATIDPASSPEVFEEARSKAHVLATQVRKLHGKAP